MVKKKVVTYDVSIRRSFIDESHAEINIQRQCELLEICRSGYYYNPRPENKLNLTVMKLLEIQFLKTPYYGVVKMTLLINKMGYSINVKRVRRLLRTMGLTAIYPKIRTSKNDKEHKKYPYLLRNIIIQKVNQVWCSDITYIGMLKGFMYLTVVMDWYSRYVISWRISNSLESSFCKECLNEALLRGVPEIFNTDQGVQYTSTGFVEIVEENGIKISMDSKGRCFDNIMNERLWRSVKYEYVYLSNFETGKELYNGLDRYFREYNELRPHQSLGYNTPLEVYSGLARYKKIE